MTTQVMESLSTLNPWTPQPAILADITPEYAGVQTYHLRFADADYNAAYQYAPGQFNMLYVPGYGEVAISVSAGPSERGERLWSHTIRTVGNVTQALARLSVGSTIGVRGPFGVGWPLAENKGRDIVIAAGGIGLAPLRPVIDALNEHSADFGRRVLLYGARSPDTLLFARQYLDWAAAGWQILLTVDRASPDWHGAVGVVPALLERLQPWEPGNAALFTCGPEIMMKFVIKSALTRGLAPDRIWLSLERNMQCGVGICGHCQLGPLFVCKDGPVARLDAVEEFVYVPGL